MTKQAVVAAESKDAVIFIDEDMMTGPTGFENVSASDLLIPRLTILQKMSPQIDEGDPSYIQGAKYGDFCDTGTNEVFKELVVVPCFFAMVYLEWGPRGSGKGLVQNHGTDATILRSCTPDDKRRMMLPNGNYIAETATWYVLNLSANGRKSFIPLTSTGLKHSRRWLTMLTSEKLRGPNGDFTPPMWYRTWNVSTVEEKNNDGSWKNWKFSAGEPINQVDPSKSILKMAKEFHEQAKEGLVRGDVAGDAESNAKGEDIPF